MSTAVKDSSYFIPAPSKWPAVGSVSMILTLFGAAGLVNAVPNSHFVLIAGLLVLVYMFLVGLVKLRVSRKRVSMEQR